MRGALCSCMAMAAGMGLAAPARGADEGLAPVMVTATRTQTQVNELVADVTVLDRDRIESARGLSVAAFLARVPGVQFSSNGGIGASTNLFIRGGDARHVLLLIDGVRAGSATTGTPALESLPLDQIERIEIVRGPLAALYGADAAAGVIQVFTRRGKAGLRRDASLTLGTLDHRAMSLGVSGGEGPWTLGVQAAAQATAGFSATNRLRGADFNPDRDGFSQRSWTVQAGMVLPGDWRAEAQFLRADAASEYDDGVPRGTVLETEKETLAETGHVRLGGKLMPDWQTALTASRSVDRQETLVAIKPTNLGLIRTAQTQWAWEHRIATSLGLALVTVEQLRQSVESSSTNFAVKARTMRALVLGLSGEAGRHVWQGAARRDWNSQFGKQDTGSLAYGFDVLPAWRAGGSVGTSFVVPTFNQLYNPQGNFGDPTLKPENGLNKEVSLRWLRGADSFKLVYFHNRIRNYIQSVRRASGGSRAAATPRVDMRGWSLQGGSSGDGGWGTWDVQGALDVLDTHNTQTGRKLRQRADTTVSIEAGLTQGRWRYGVHMRANDGSFDEVSTRIERLPGYSLWGLNLAWAFEPGWRLSLKVDNFSDKRIQTIYGYNQPGRQFMVTMSYSGT